MNWDPVSQTALADDEVESREIDGHFWYLRYPLVDDNGAATGEHVTVATTRPETMLGDTAVAVNPDDPERAALVGRQVKLPLANRIIPIIADDYVVKPDANSEDPKARMASGFLKVTPAHDPNDWDIGQRHGLEAINVMAPDGSINAEYGWTDAEAMEPEAQGLLGLIDLKLETNSSRSSGNEDFWKMSGPTNTQLGTRTDPTFPSNRACPTSGTCGSATTDWWGSSACVAA